MSYRIINGQAYPVGNFGQINSTQTNKSKIANNKDKTSFKDVLDNVKK